MVHLWLLGAGYQSQTIPTTKRCGILIALAVHLGDVVKTAYPTKISSKIDRRFACR
jgi:hypothetical protein